MHSCAAQTAHDELWAELFNICSGFQQSLSVSNNNSPSGTQTTDAVEGIFAIVIMDWINWIQLKPINNVCNCNGFNGKRL